MLPDLPLAARVAHVFSELNSKSLISIGQLYYSNQTDEFTRNEVIIHQDGGTILRGTCIPDSGLWHINLTTASPTWTPSPGACENLMTNEL